MASRLIRLEEVAWQPWKNGGGRTRELLAWPEAEAWDLRVSVADIERDGPFSAFPGVDRRFVVLSGAGVVLAFHDRTQGLHEGDAMIVFRGEDAPGCGLIDGPTRDLNIMSRRERVAVAVEQARFAGRPGRAECPLALSGELELRCLFARDPLVAVGAERVVLPAMSLLVGAEAGLVVESAGARAPRAWWIGVARRDDAG